MNTVTTKPADRVNQEPTWDDDRLESVHTQPDKGLRVRRMFDSIAPTYERINALLSFGRDRHWRRRAVELSKVAPGESVLDVACGTGDLLRAFDNAGGQLGDLIGVDFSHQMLIRATAGSPPHLRWCESDALRLPFTKASFDVVTCGFGVRNLQDLTAGLSEMHRVLRPGGRVVILEFTRPRNRVVRTLHEFYAGRIMPRAAGIISGDKTGAYRYLPKSVVSFASAAQMCKLLEQTGFAGIKSAPLTFGVVTIYTATKKSV